MHCVDRGVYDTCVFYILKNKINKEININRKNHNELYKYNDDKDYVINQIIKEEFAMIKLQEYLDYEYSFMDYTAKYYDKDIIIYYIDIDLINIWLQDTFNFVNNYLDKVDENNYNNILSILNDKYLGNGFTSVFDTALGPSASEVMFQFPSPITRVRLD